MAEKIMEKGDLINDLAERTGFYKMNIREIVDAFGDLLIDQLNTADFEEDSRIYLAPGVYIGGQRVPEKETRDPRNGSKVISPEKVIPYAKFTQTFRNKFRVEKKYKKVTR